MRGTQSVISFRQRLGAPELDGVNLVDRIGESDPRLPLTDFVTESDINMHKGLVNILRGVVWCGRPRRC
jgi:hypothetical protein